MHVGTEVVFLNATDVCVADVPGAWRRRRREGSDPANAGTKGAGANAGAGARGAGANAKGNAGAKGGGSGIGNAKGGIGRDAGKGREERREEEERAEGVIEKSVVFNDIDHYLRLIRQKNRMTGQFRRSHIFTGKNSII